MTFFFTQEELVQYLYHETSPSKTAEIEEALQENWGLREKLEVLQASMQALNNVAEESPRTEVIMNIMNYARESMEETFHHH